MPSGTEFKEFSRVWSEFKKIPFPSKCGLEVIDEIGSRILDMDYEIAGLAMSLAGNPLKPGWELRGMDQYLSRVEGIIVSHRSLQVERGSAEVIEDYGLYLTKMKELILAMKKLTD